MLTRMLTIWSFCLKSRAGTDTLDNYPQTSGSVPLYLGIRLMYAHAQKPNKGNQNCNKMAVDKCLALCYQL